ncbi:MAG TPA: hypothetical protein VL995_11180 [Cellvibrio sp.]|nr:hypothetical protein [Cellvibrio sp.]
MPVKTPFKYSECFTNKTLARIPEKLKIKGTNDPNVLLLIRLLSGSLKVEHVSTSKTFHQKENFFSADFEGYAQNWYKRFPELIAENYSAEQFAEYLDSTKLNNRSFYKNILSEISYFFLYQSKGINSSAFVFLYRALEHVSYAFPLIYAAKTDDFSKTFSFLKDLMNGDKSAGELGFFKSFLKTVYKGDPIYESSVDFPMLLATENEQKEIFNLLKDLCKGDMIADATDNPRVLAIRYTEVGSFIITIRNRFFHYMNGGSKNIESSNISDVDILFSLINKKCLYWFSTVLLAVVTHNALEFESIKARIS